MCGLAGDNELSGRRQARARPGPPHVESAAPEGTRPRPVPTHSRAGSAHACPRLVAVGGLPAPRSPACPARLPGSDLGLQSAPLLGPESEGVPVVGCCLG